MPTVQRVIEPTDCLVRYCLHCEGEQVSVGDDHFRCLQCIADGCGTCTLVPFSRWTDVTTYPVRVLVDVERAEDGGQAVSINVPTAEAGAQGALPEVPMLPVEAIGLAEATRRLVGALSAERAETTFDPEVQASWELTFAALQLYDAVLGQGPQQG